MPWPSKITTAFATFEGSFYENKYYAPYNKLFYTLFPANSDFIVSPNYIRNYNEDGTDFIVLFEITFRQHLVLILEVKPPQDMSYPSKREAADMQVRRCLSDLSECASEPPGLPVLYGISAIGTRLCFYEFERALRRVTPQRICSDPEFIVDVAPQERWDCDVLEADGEQRLRALVAQITEACVHFQA